MLLAAVMAWLKTTLRDRQDSAAVTSLPYAVYRKLGGGMVIARVGRTVAGITAQCNLIHTWLGCGTSSEGSKGAALRAVLQRLRCAALHHAL